MQPPSSSEQYITIVDNKGREKVQFVEYFVEDVRGEKVYVTSDGLAYAEDSLTFKLQEYLIAEFNHLPDVLVQPDIVIWVQLIRRVRRCSTTRTCISVSCKNGSWSL